MSDMTTLSNVFSLRSTRIAIDPNSQAPGEESLTLAEFDDADGDVFEGEIVIVVQESDRSDEPDLVGSARVVKTNPTYGLIYLSVDWDSFSDAPTLPRKPAVGVNSRPFSGSDFVVESRELAFA